MDNKEHRCYFPAGARIFAEGEPGDCAYSIEEGRVEVSTLRKGEPLVLAELGPGDIFGEMALIDNKVRSASVTALTETRLLVIQRERFAKKMASADPLISLFLRVILDRLRKMGSEPLTKLGGAEGGGLEAPSSEAPLGESGHGYHRSRDRAIQRLRLENELEKAFEKGDFELHYQPIWSLSEERISAFEALIRWRHRERGLLLPAEFIGLAEETGWIVPIGRWAIREACRALSTLRDVLGELAVDSALTMGANISSREIADPQFVSNIAQIVDECGIRPEQLRLEITESLLMEDPDLATVVLDRLKEIGVKLAIDDFGTGYSSLSYLHRFPIDTLKIDRSFICSMLTEPGSLEIVRTLSQLAHNLGMDTVAEGVERPEELRRLTTLDCDYGQGFLISKPLPERAMATLVAQGVASY